MSVRGRAEPSSEERRARGTTGNYYNLYPPYPAGDRRRNRPVHGRRLVGALRRPPGAPLGPPGSALWLPGTA